MRAPLRSSWAKLDRAKEQADTIRDQLAEATDPQQHPIVLDGKFQLEPAPPIQGKVIKRAVVRIAAMPAIDEGTVLLLGEALNNFRACLDHMTWVLVRLKGRNPLTAREARSVAFPFTRKRKTYWKDAGTRLLPDVPRDPFLTLIERYQPYRRSPVGRAMKALGNLSDTDKHRFVIPALMPLYGADLQVKVQGCEPLVPLRMYLRERRPLKPGARLVETILATDPGTPCDMTVEGSITTFPELPGTHTDARRTLEVIAATCSEIVSEIEALL